MSAKLLTASGGGVILDAANTATDKTLTLPALDDTVLTRTTNVTSGTAVASTSGTSIDFTGIPSWVKRITVMYQSVSTNGASIIQCQLGAGSITASGYVGSSDTLGAGTGGPVAYTTGLGVGRASSSTYVRTGIIVFTNVSGNIWVGAFTGSTSVGNVTTEFGSTVVTLVGTLDRLRITTVNGTDTFDAGSINILYE